MMQRKSNIRLLSAGKALSAPIHGINRRSKRTLGNVYKTRSQQMKAISTLGKLEKGRLRKEAFDMLKNVPSFQRIMRDPVAGQPDPRTEAEKEFAKKIKVLISNNSNFQNSNILSTLQYHMAELEQQRRNAKSEEERQELIDALSDVAQSIKAMSEYVGDAQTQANTQANAGWEEKFKDLQSKMGKYDVSGAKEGLDDISVNLRDPEHSFNDQTDSVSAETIDTFDSGDSFQSASSDFIEDFSKLEDADLFEIAVNHVKSGGDSEFFQLLTEELESRNPMYIQELQKELQSKGLAMPPPPTDEPLVPQADVVTETDVSDDDAPAEAAAPPPESQDLDVPNQYQDKTQRETAVELVHQENKGIISYIGGKKQSTTQVKTQLSKGNAILFDSGVLVQKKELISFIQKNNSQLYTQRKLPFAQMVSIYPRKTLWEHVYEGKPLKVVNFKN